MKKFTVLFFVIVSVAVFMTYGFNFPFNESQSGLKTAMYQTPSSPLNLQSPDAVSGYTFSQSTTTYTPAFGGTLLCAAGCDDGVHSGITLPFTFNFNGTAFTTVSISQNGWLAMGTQSISGYSPICTGTFPNIIAAFARDLYGLATGDSLRYLTTGTTPNRVFTVEWSKWGIYSSGLNELSFQIKLYETTNNIDIVYKPETPTTSATDIQVGLMGSTNADFLNRTSTTSWTATTAGTTACSYLTFSSTVYPSAGLTFSYVPPASFAMTYVSSTTVQITGGLNIPQSSPNNQILQVQVVMDGTDSVITMTGLNFNTTGTTNPADFANAKVYYTGTTNTFSTSTLFGTVTSPSGAFAVTGSQQLAAGTNYFWLTYDATAGAVIGDYADAQCVSIVGSGTMGTRLPTVTDPAGRRQIDNYCRGTYSNNGCLGTGIYITNVTVGTLNNTSTCDPDGNFPYAYSWFTNLSATLQQGVTYPISASTFASSNAQGFAVWVDWDNNNLFDASEYNAFPLVTSGSPVTTSTFITVPAGASLGNHRMRVRNNLSAAPVSTASCTALSYGETEDYTINVVAGAPMAYTSSTVTQNNITPFNTPSLNTEVIGVQVVVSGSLSPLNATSFTFNTTGSTNPVTDITNAKLWYTGISNAFATNNQFGTAFLSPNGTFTVTGTKTLLPGTNYFWLTYDVPVSATGGDVIDAECTSLTVGTPQTPTVTAPAGSRTIGTNKLSGIYTIPGSYPNFTTAIADLNSKGISGPVTFNVSSGFSDTAVNLVINTTGTASNPIVFQRFGADPLPNPVINAGVGISTTVDGIIKLNGADYITFDGIDLMENPANITATTRMEWGYALVKPNGTNGCQNVTIKNCNITLNKANLPSVGIYSANHLPTSTSTFTVNTPTGTSSNNTFFNNSITNSYIGIALYGFVDGTVPYSFYDQNNTIDQNTITNYGGGANTAYGIYDIYQNGLSITNCIINSTGGTNSTSTLYGIFCSTMNNSNLTITGNTVTIASGATTSSIYGINFGNASAGTTNTVNVSNNTIQNSTYATATSGAMYALYCNATTSSLTVSGNRIIGNTYGTTTSTGTYYGIYSVSGAINTLNITNNLDSGNTVLGTTSYSPYRIYNAGATNALTATGNSIKNNILGGTTATATCYGIYNTTGTFTCNISNNTVSDNSLPTTSSQSIYFIYTTSTAPTFDCNYNTVSNNTGSGTGTFYGIYYSATTAAGSTENITNNNVLNLTKTTATGTGTIYGIYRTGSGLGTINVNNNTVTGFTSAAATTMYGIYQIGSPPNYLNINNNKVGNLTTGGASIIYGIYNNPTATAYVTHSQDSVFNLTSLGGAVYGMYTANGAVLNLSRNIISGLTSSTGTTATVFGMYIAGGITTNAFNNIISDLNTPASTTITPAISGIYVSAGTYTNAYYNTIYLNATSTSATTFGTAGIYASTTPVVDLRNNVVVNTSTPGPTGGQTVAYRRSSTTLTTFSANSNNNCYFAGTPAANRLIYYDGTNSDQTLTAYKTRVNPRENASVTENPPFVNGITPPYDLRIQTGTATQLESGGLTVSAPFGITNDAFGTARYPNSGYPVGGFSPTAPDIGAHEFGGLNSGTGAPYISYTALGIGGTSNRAFNNVIITDANGINTTAGTKPRCYYKRSTDSNVVNDNTSSTDGWKYAEANGTTSPFDFTIDYSRLVGGTGVAAGNTVQYFVIAQDLSGTPVTGWNQATFAVIPATVSLATSNCPITLTGSYTIGTNTFSGAYNVGASQTYTSLTGAAGIFAAINAGVLSGDITINITSDMTEDGTNALNPINETGPGGYKVRIVPADATPKVISGAVAQGMIRLSGSKRVTFDGNNGLGSKYLTFRNTNGLYPTFIFINDASKDSIKNCYIESNNASTTTTQAGTILFSTTTGLQGNDSNVIASCDIRDRSDATGYPAFGIYNNGTTTTIPQYNSYNVVTGCNIYNFFLDAASSTGGIWLNNGNTDWTITGNSFYQTVTRTVTLGATFSAIYNNNSANNNNNQITNNYIGGTAPLCGGTPMTYTGAGLYNFYGIQAFVNVLAPTNITGNTIKNISLTTSPASGTSTFFKAIYAQTGWINVNNNIIGAPTGNDNITLTTNLTTGSYVIALIQHNGIGSVDNNTMGSVTYNGTSTGTGDSYYGITYSNTTAGYTYSVNNNLIGSLTTPNSIQQTKTVTGTAFRGILLANGAGTTNNITNNTIANITDFSTSTLYTASVYGVSNSGAGNYNFAGNTVRNLTNNCNVPSASFLLGGIFSTGAGINTYTQNNIYSFYALGTGAGAQLVGGMLCGGTTGGSASKNKIFDFKQLGTGVLAPAPLLLGFNVQSTGPYTISNNVVSLTNGDLSDAVTQELLKSVQNTSNKVNVSELKQKVPSNAKVTEGSASEQVLNENPISQNDLEGLYDKNASQNVKKGKELVKDEPLSSINGAIAGVYSTSTSTGTSNYYFNSFYIGGSQPSGNYASWAFVRTNSGAVAFKNNLFVNLRTGGLAAHYVIGNEAPAPASGWNSSASDYNIYIGNANTIGEWGANNSQTLVQWIASSGGDVNSSSANIPGTTLFRNIAAGDLNIDTTQYGATYIHKRGVGINGYPTDINGYPRATSGPVNVGSHEFTLIGNVLCTLVSPANNATGIQSPVNLVWRKALYATGYKLQISPDSTFSSTYIDLINADSIYSFTPPNLTLTYYWRVAPAYPGGAVNNYTSAWRFTTIPPVPTAPALLTPANNSIDIPVTAPLDWSDVVYAASYRVQVSTSSSFTTTAFDTIGLTASQITVPPGKLSTLTLYYWRVSATNVAGTGPYSTIWNFTTAPNAPNVPILSLPANGSINQPLTVTFKWFKAVETLALTSSKEKGSKEEIETEKGTETKEISKTSEDEPLTISKYWFEYSTDSTFATVIATDTTLLDTTKILSGLNGSTKYFWRVKAKNQTGWGNFSAIWNFTTLNQSLGLNLKVYLEGFWNGTTQVTDTVTVYLANSSTFAFADTAKVVLGTAGTSSPVFNRASGGSYYIVINHRNHLETWSRLPQTFVPGTPLTYDFTTDSAKAYGFNMKKSGSVWVLYGGDPNRDGSIDGVDIALFITQFGLQGYLSCDFDGDGDVTASDVQIIAANFGLTKSVPSFEYIEPGKKTERIKIEDALKEVNKGREKSVNDRKTDNRKNVKTGNN